MTKKEIIIKTQPKTKSILKLLPFKSKHKKTNFHKKKRKKQKLSHAPVPTVTSNSVISDSRVRY